MLEPLATASVQVCPFGLLMARLAVQGADKAASHVFRVVCPVGKGLRNGPAALKVYQLCPAETQNPTPVQHALKLSTIASQHHTRREHSKMASRCGSRTHLWR